MALINFDCPECGHNLEVDEGGAGFIVKCPECANPLQIPDLPTSRRYRKLATAAATLGVILILFGINLCFWSQNRDLHEQLAEQQQTLDLFLQQAQSLAMQQDAEIAHLKKEVDRARVAAQADLANAALDALEEAQALAQALDETNRRFLEASPAERTTVLRDHMTARVAAARNSLPAQPQLTDVGPGRGIQGRQVVFPVLPGPDGQVLRENAEVTSAESEKISVRFAGGTATYHISELHPGVSAFLPVDPLMALPRSQWGGEVMRVHQLNSARRDERLAEIRHAIESHLSPE